MTFRLGNLVKETTTTTGTGALTLLGASSGYRPFSAVCLDGDTVPYMIGAPGDANREVGLATWNTGNILSRSAILESSNSNAVVSLPAGTKQVSLVMPAETMGISNSECGGRLTLLTGDPFGIANTTGTVIYWTPTRSAEVTLYDKLLWCRFYFHEISYTIAGTSANSNYDLFVWNNAGTLTLSRGPAWTSNTARGTGAGTTELWMFEGVLVNLRDISGGPPAFTGRYVGSFRTTATANQTIDTIDQRFLANLYHPFTRYCSRNDGTSHTINNQTQAWNAGTNTRVQWLQCYNQYISINVHALVQYAAGANLFLFPLLDGAQVGDFGNASSVTAMLTLDARATELCSIGYHYAEIGEAEYASANVTLSYGYVFVDIV